MAAHTLNQQLCCLGKASETLALSDGLPLQGTSENSHRRRTAEFQPSSPCKNLDCPPGEGFWEIFVPLLLRPRLKLAAFPPNARRPIYEIECASLRLTMIYRTERQNHESLFKSSAVHTAYVAVGAAGGRGGRNRIRLRDDRDAGGYANRQLHGSRRPDAHA